VAKGFQFEPDRGAIQQAGMVLARRAIIDVTRRVLNRAIILTPVDTGNLRAANQMRIRQQGTKVTGEVFNPVAYAAFVHDGTQAHTVRPKPNIITVRPKNAKMLRFVINGRVVFARSVRMQSPLRFTIGGRTVFAQSARIPAKRGRPWLLRAMREVAGSLGWKVTEL
jgi:hypothetical protein